VLSSFKNKTHLQYFILTLFLCLPLIFTTYIPLVDYPSHLARCYIITHYHQSAFFQQHYRLAWGPIPNLAMDLIIPWLIPLAGAIWAGKLFLLGLLLLYSFSCYFLAREVYGYYTKAAFIPLFFFYNSTFLMGFINYVAGVSLFVLTLAVWLRWRRNWSIAKWLVFCILVGACYLAHLSSVAILVLCIMTLLIREIWLSQANRIQPMVLTTALAGPWLAYRFFMHTGGSVGSIIWNSPKGKLIALLDIVRGYSIAVDSLLILILLACIAYAVVIRTKLTIYPVVLIPALALLVAFVLCPLILYTSSGADARFIWPACILLSLSFQFELPQHKSRILLNCIVLAFLLHLGTIWSDWYRADREAQSVVQTFKALPRNATLYPAFYNLGSVDMVKQHHGLEHLACYAVMTRDAFVPTVFAQQGQQPLVMQPKYSYHVWDEQGYATREYDYLWAYQPPPKLVQWLWRSKLMDSYLDSSVWKLTYKTKSNLILAE
jgi:hypothetical protein